MKKALNNTGNITKDLQVSGGVEDTRLEAKAKDTKKNSEAKDSPSEDRPFRSQGQGHRRKCSQKKKVFKQVFQANSKQKVFKKFFQAIYKILTIQKTVQYSSREQGNFRGLEASRQRTWPSRPKQGFQNRSSRTPLLLQVSL